MKDKIEYIIVRFLVFIFRLLPYDLAFSMGEFIGYLLYLIDKKHKNIARENLEKAFCKEKNTRAEYRGKREIDAIIKEVFKNIGRSFIEFINLPKLKNKLREIVKIEGIENLHKAFEKKKGVIAIVSHFGNWELIGATFPTIYPGRCSAIAFPQGNVLTDKLINDIRRNAGLKIIFTGPSVKNVLKSLNKGEIVGFLADQDAGDGGVFVDFFGKYASTAKGPISLALRSGVPVIMAFIMRENRKTHRMVITEELILNITGDEEKDILVNTGKWVRILEDFIRKYPQQWFWVHRRWKTQN